MPERSPELLSYIAGVVDAAGFVKDDGEELAIQVWFSRDLKELIGDDIGYNINAPDEPKKLKIYFHREDHRDFLTELLPYLRQEVVATKIRGALSGVGGATGAGAPSEVVCDSCYTPNGHSQYCPEREFGADPDNEALTDMGLGASAPQTVPVTEVAPEPDPLAGLKQPEDTDNPDECRICYLQANDEYLEGDKCGTHRAPSDDELVSAIDRRTRTNRKPRGERGRDRAKAGTS